jgi:hypothetical protein
MIAHVVLFQPRADLSPTDREAFAAAFERAITEIPQVRRARVGAGMSVAFTISVAGRMSMCRRKPKSCLMLSRRWVSGFA